MVKLCHEILQIQILQDQQMILVTIDSLLTSNNNVILSGLECISLHENHYDFSNQMNFRKYGMPISMRICTAVGHGLEI